MKKLKKYKMNTTKSYEAYSISDIVTLRSHIEEVLNQPDMWDLDHINSLIKEAHALRDAFYASKNKDNVVWIRTPKEML